MAELTIRAAGVADPRVAAYFDGQHHPQHALPQRVGYVASHNGTVIGYIAGHLTTRHGCEGEVQYLFVAPGRRRCGVATELLRLLGNWFRQHGARKVCVAVAADTPQEALPFFESASASPLKKNWYAWEDVSVVIR
ncbi:MAG: GNAT family N-acetyltransferase [Candidatus Acidiferrales bacterium]